MNLWLVVCGVGALLMRAGLALNLAGSVRAKNSAGVVMRTLMDLAVAVLAFYALGLLIYHPPDPFFQTTVTLISSGIVVGVAAERTRFFPMLLASILAAGILAPIAGRWTDLGWLSSLGFRDFGRASMIHLTGALCAAAAAFVVGPRLNKYNRDGSSNAIPGHSMPLASLGAIIMLIGFFPAILGFALPVEATAVAMNILLAAAAGTIVSLLVCQWRYGKPDIHFTFMGMLGALVAITPAADVNRGAWAILIGAIAGFLVPAASLYIDLIWRIDDPTGGIAIHGIGAIWGLLAAAIFAPDLQFADRFKLIGIQALGAAAIAALALLLSLGLFVLLKMTVGLRSKEADEYDGLDLAEHDVGAYPDFQQNTIKSYHLREA